MDFSKAKRNPFAAAKYACEASVKPGGCKAEGTEVCPGGERYCRRHYDALGPEDLPAWVMSKIRHPWEKGLSVELRLMLRSLVELSIVTSQTLTDLGAAWVAEHPPKKKRRKPKGRR